MFYQHKSEGQCQKMSNIEFYDPKNAYGEFSNYYSSPILVDGITYPTVEHYFQAQKFLGPNATLKSREYAQIIASQNTANKAKILANQKTGGGYKWRTALNPIIEQYADVSMRSEWEIVKDNVMRKGVFQKFFQHPKLRSVLFGTGQAYLAEHTTRDSYWGDGGNGSGLNMLGRILMETRSMLQGELLSVSPGNYWVIKNVLLIGEPNVPLLNQLGINFLMDLTGQNILQKQILGESHPQKVYLYQGSFIFVNGADVSLLLEAIGKKYPSYVYGGQEILPLLFESLYGITAEIAHQLTSRLLN